MKQCLTFLYTLTLLFFYSQIGSAKLLSSNPIQEFQFYNTSETTLQNGKKKKLSDHPLDQIFSEKSFLVRKGLKSITLKLPELIENKSFKQKHLDRILSLLSHKSKTIRFQSLELLRKNGGMLFRNKFLTREIITRFAENAYASSEDVIAFLALLDALLPYENNNPFMLSEYSFLILEGLTASRYEAAEITKDILVRYGTLLVKKKYWVDKHVDKFLLISRDLPEDNKLLYISVLESMLPDLVKFDLINKKGFMNTVALVQDSKVGVREQYIKFLTNTKILPYLFDLDIFDSEWTEQLIKNIVATEFKGKQMSLEILSNLFVPFLAAEALTKDDFDKLWSYISANLDAFENPFDIVIKNIRVLSSKKWFTKTHFSKIMIDLDKKNISVQKQIFQFLNDHYKTLNRKGWIKSKPLVEAIFHSDYKDEEIKILKLNLLQNHPSILRNYSLFDAKELYLFLDNLDDADSEIFNMSYDILKYNSTYWTRNGTINTKIITKLTEREPSDKRTADVIKIIDSVYPVNPKIFNERLILTLSNMGFSPIEDVRKSTRDFFVKYYHKLKQQKVMTSKIKRSLKESGILSYVKMTRVKPKLD